MARKNTLYYKVAEAQSLSSSFISSPTVVTYLDNCAYQLNVTTTNSIGTFKVQGSLDYKISEPGTEVQNPGQWADLPLGGGTPFVNAANDTILIDLNQIPFSALRIVYTAGTPGTGTVDIMFVSKQLGG